MKFLSEWTADDIRLAIKKDVDLEKIIIRNRDKAKPLGSFVDLFNPEWKLGDLLYWFSMRRPDLYKALVESEEGIRWLSKNWKKRMRIKKILSNI